MKQRRVSGAVCCGDLVRPALRCDGALRQRTPSPTCSLCASDTAALALGDEVAALLDFAQDAVALHRLAEAREQVLT
jgi:hypothetical protein